MGVPFYKKNGQPYTILMYPFPFDKNYRQDIEGSKAHVKMLAKQGILTKEDEAQILEGLRGILRRGNGTLGNHR